MKKKVVLVNPPGREGVIRDYYCGHLAKGRYMWPPLDLLVTSGYLRGRCDCVALDAVVEKVSEDRTLELLESYGPDAVVCLVAAISWRNDMRFLQRVRQRTAARIIVSGDLPRAFPQKVLAEQECIDAVLFDFAAPGLAGYVCEDAKAPCDNIITRARRVQEAAEPKTFSYPVPQHELFPLSRYHLHHVYYHPFVPLLTTFGCMHSCTFCPFERIPFKLRQMSNIGEELSVLRSMGIKEILLQDQSFGSHEHHALSFCQLLENRDSPFSWSCEMRVDAATGYLLRKMKETGCHTVMFGVESADEKVLQRHKKGIRLSQIREAFSLAKRLRLRTLAHVMMGMEGEDEASQERLIRFCLELDPHYVSFNIAAPLWNTTFRERLTQEGRIFDPRTEVDSSYERPVWESDRLSADDVVRMHRKAVRRFYLRPSYLFKNFLTETSRYRRGMMLREGIRYLARFE